MGRIDRRAARTGRSRFDKPKRARAKLCGTFQLHFGSSALTRENSPKFAGDGIALKPGGRLARDDKDIGPMRKVGTVAAKILSYPPLDAIANHRVAHFGANRDP